jgi:signal transduction histidine kinase
VNSPPVFPDPAAILAYVEERSHLLAIRFAHDGRVLAANRHSAQLVGDDLLAQGRSRIWLDFDGTNDGSIAAAASGQTRFVSIATASGLPETFNAILLPDPDGVLLLGERDHDELSRLRVELLSANRDLNNLTRELHKKHAELQRLNDLKNQFLGMAAHDLRSPIANIFGLSELLLEEAVERLNEQHLYYLSTMRNLSDFMLQMLNDLLDITAIESGHLNLRIESTDLSDVVSQSVTLHRLHAQRKHIHVDWTPVANFPSAQLDPSKMLQAVNNLVSNAVKYTPVGGRVRIVLLAHDSHWRLAVQDTGAGISEADRARLFNPFVKLSTKPTDGEKSTGLGLAIVQKIMAAHAGRAGIEPAQPDAVGSCFFLEGPWSLPSRA